MKIQGHTLRNSILLLVVLILAALVGLAASPRKTSTSAASRWEYDVVQWNDSKKLADEANQLGAQGWEMVDVIQDLRSGSGGWGYAYFKRPRP